MADGTLMSDHPGFCEPLKEYCFAHIIGRVTHRRLKIRSLQQFVLQVKKAIEFFLKRKRTAFIGLLPSDHDAYLKFLRQDRPPSLALRQLSAFLDLYRASTISGIELNLGTPPSFLAISAPRLIGHRHRVRGDVKQTCLIPDEILWPLFNRCVEYLEKISPYVLTLKRRFDVSEAAFFSYPIDDSFGKRRPSAPIHLRRLFGGKHREASKEFAKLALGLKRPETGLLPNGIGTPKELRSEIRATKTACFIILGLVTGMRKEELLSVEEGCLSETQSIGGSPIVWIEGILTKSVRNEKGMRTKWVCGPYGQLAATILESLTATQRRVFDSRKLFVSIIRTYGDHPTQIWNRDAGGINFKHDFKQLAVRLDLRKPDGSLFEMRANQMRRTFIRMVTRFGDVSIHSLQLHCKHLNYHMTDYYVGADLGLWLEFQEENEEMKRRVLADMFGSHELAGLGGRRQVSDINEAIETGRLPQDFRGQSGDAIRLKWADRLLRGGKRINFYTTNVCDVSNSADSKCNPDPNGKPIANRCQPAMCANSKIGPSHLPVWRVVYQMAKDALADPRIKKSAILRAPLKRELENARAVMSDLGHTPE